MTWLFIIVIITLVIILSCLMAVNGGLNERVDDAEAVIEDYHTSLHRLELLPEHLPVDSTLMIYCKKWGVVLAADNRLMDKGKRRR